MPFSNIHLLNKINESKALLSALSNGGVLPSDSTSFTGLNNFVNTLQYHGKQIALHSKVRYVNEDESITPALENNTKINLSCGTFNEVLNIKDKSSIVIGGSNLTYFTGDLEIDGCLSVTFKDIFFFTNSTINVINSRITFENCWFSDSTISIGISFGTSFLNCSFTSGSRITNSSRLLIKESNMKGVSILNNCSRDNVVILDSYSLTPSLLDENVTFRGLSRYRDTDASDYNTDRYYATEILPLDDDELTTKDYVDKTHKLVGFQATMSPISGTWVAADEILPFDSVKLITSDGAESYCYDTENGFNISTHMYTIKKVGYYDIKYGIYVKKSEGLVAIHVIRTSTGIDSIIRRGKETGQVNIKLDVGDQLYVRASLEEVVLQPSNNYFSATLIGS